MTAVNVTPTADANVADNFMPDQQLFGMVSRKPAPWASPNDSPPGTGVIDFKYDSKLFHASYAVTDMVDNPVRHAGPLLIDDFSGVPFWAGHAHTQFVGHCSQLGMEEGDIVSFFLAINKVTLAPRAVNVSLDWKFSGRRQRPATPGVSLPPTLSFFSLCVCTSVCLSFPVLTLPLPPSPSLSLYLPPSPPPPPSFPPIPPTGDAAPSGKPRGCGTRARAALGAC